MRIPRLLVAAGLLASCSAPMPDLTAMLPPLASAPTTVEQTIVPVHPYVVPADPGPPSDPSVLAHWLAEGYGATTSGAGEPLLPFAPPNQTAPAAGANPTLLVRFTHLSDTHLVDDESPIRLCGFDLPGATSGSFRPQEGDECRVLDAAVRTMNAIHAQLPLAFVLTGGDNSDSAQQNELQWFMQIMNGAPVVKCDSGNPDDPVPGPNNDGKDPFAAVGLAMPWWWVTGNHDVLIEGTLTISDIQRSEAIADDAQFKTRDYTQPGAPLFTGPVIPDAHRLPLRRAELMPLIAADKEGHGIGASQVASGKAFYQFDVAGTPLRFVILDTGAESGGSDGVVHQADVDATLRPMLDQARSDGKWVVLASHHATGSISDGSDAGGSAQADALTPDAWLDLLGSYGNIVYSMVGHSHLNRIHYAAPAMGHGFWEVYTGALADYPHQFRLVEIWDEDNGWLKLSATVINYATDGDPVAASARVLGVSDRVSGWEPDGYGAASDRNVELFIPKPQ